MCFGLLLFLPWRAFNIQTTAGEGLKAGASIQQVSAALMRTRAGGEKPEDFLAGINMKIDGRGEKIKQ